MRKQLRRMSPGGAAAAAEAASPKTAPRRAGKR
jgi:hypothetical protein